MQYSINNVTVSVLVHVATVLKAAGWRVFWQASGETEPHTASGEALGTVSLLQDIPADPTFIAMPQAGDYTRQDVVVLPAFAISVTPPRKLRRIGLGDYRFERETTVRLAGIVASSRQQTTLASTLYDWLQVGEDHHTMVVKDYESNPSAPTDLAPVDVWFVNVATPEIGIAVESIRYRVNITLILRYVE